MRTFLLSIFSICIFSSHLLQAAPLTETEKFFVLKQAKGKYEKDTDGDGRADRRDAFPYDPTEWLDTDRDGTGNNADTDDDNDGIPDTDDAFPLDKTEWLDSDKDGIGNNADTDDDNDGVLDRDDKFPTDPAEGLDKDGDGIGDNRDQYDEDAMCWRVEDADANGCLLTQLGSLQANQVAGDGGNTIVFIDKAGQKLYRYALDSKTITLRQELTEINSSAKHILIYHKQHQKYYFTESNGRQLFSLTATGASATLQRELPSMSYQLHDAGKFLVVELVNDGIYDGKSLIINSSGATTTQQSTYFGQNTVFDPNHKRLFHFRDGSSPNDVYWREINQTSGVLGAVLESPYHGSFSIIGPIRVSNDGKRVLLGSGDVYNSADLTWRSNLGGRHVDAQYLESGESVVVRHVGEAGH